MLHAWNVAARENWVKRIGQLYHNCCSSFPPCQGPGCHSCRLRSARQGRLARRCCLASSPASPGHLRGQLGRRRRRELRGQCSPALNGLHGRAVLEKVGSSAATVFVAIALSFQDRRPIEQARSAPEAVQAGEGAQQAHQGNRLLPQRPARVELEVGQALQGRKRRNPRGVHCWAGRWEEGGPRVGGRGQDGPGSFISGVCKSPKRLLPLHGPKPVKPGSPVLPTLSVSVTALSEVAATATAASAAPSHPMPLLACRLRRPVKADSAPQAGTFGATCV